MGLLSQFKKNKLDTLCVMIVVFLAVMIGTVFTESNLNLTRSLDKVKNEGSVSDFIYYPLVTEQDILKTEGDMKQAVERKNQELSEKYNFRWEEHPYSVVRETGFIYRVLSNDRKLDRFLIESGKLPVKNNELAVDKNFAREHHLEVGQSYKLENVEYKISGIITVSNMLSPVVDDKGELYDEKQQGIMVLSKEKYTQLYSDGNSIFSGKFSGDQSEIAAMQKDTQFYQLEASEDNPSVYGTITSTMNMNLIIAIFAVSLLLSIAFILIVVSTRKQIDHDIINIGVLKALGYSSLEIARKYLMSFVIVLIPAGLGYLAGYLLSMPYYEKMFHSLLLPTHEGGINPVIIMLFVLLPAIYAGGFAFITCLLKIRKPALQLMKGQTKMKVSKRIVKANTRIKETSFLTGLKRIIVRSSISTIFFVCFGGFALGVQSQFAYMTYFMTENMAESTTKGIDHQREIHYSEELDPDFNMKNTVYYYYSSAALAKGNQNLTNITLNILQDDSGSLLTLYKSNGQDKKIDLTKEEGIVINQWMSQRYDLKAGDTVSVTLDGEKHKVKIATIDQRSYGKSVYLTQKEAMKLGLLDEARYNSVLTNQKPEAFPGEAVSVIETSSLEDKMRSENETYQLLAVFLFLFGLVMGLAILILAFLNVLKSYKKYIATMKMMGYSAEECNKAVYSGFRKVAFIGYVISIPYSILLSMMMFGFLSKTTDMLYPMNVSPMSIIVCLILTIVSIELAVAFAKRQLEEVAYKEILE